MIVCGAGGRDASQGLLKAVWRTSSLPWDRRPEKDPHSGPPVRSLDGTGIQIPSFRSVQRVSSPWIGCGSPWSFRRARVLPDRRAQINMERRCVQETTMIVLG